MSQPTVTLPPEIFYLIISEHWSSQISVNERIHLMTASILVSKVWRDIFLQISYMDVYLPSSTYLRHYLHTLHVNNELLDISNICRLDTLCRSITVYSPSSRPQGQTSEDRLPTGRLLTKVMSILQALPYLPNLRTLSIEYTGFDFDSSGYQTFLKSFDDYLIHLDLKYTFGAGIPEWLIQAMSTDDHGEKSSSPWSAPYIGHVSVSGPNESVIADILSISTRYTVELNTCLGITVEILSPILDPSTNVIFHQSLPSTELQDWCQGSDSVRELRGRALGFGVAIPREPTAETERSPGRSVHLFQRFS